MTIVKMFKVSKEKTMTETVVVFFRAVITIWNNQPLLKAWKLSVNILGSLLPLLVGGKS